MNILQPVLQPYAWGSHSFIQSFLGISLPGPIAEAWYSAHPKAPSLLCGEPLDVIIAKDPHYWLGAAEARLPYLLKILAAEQALSVQVHPSKVQAELGFERENETGIPLESPIRNYKDDNHKPEMMLALTDFHALCGFRKYNEIAEIFSHFGITGFFQFYGSFAKNPCSTTFSLLHQEILLQEPLPELMHHIRDINPGGNWQAELMWCKRLLEQYPADRSVISPMLMNLIHMRPLDAIFLEEGIVHAYLHGAGIEIMASSDNVLRAGLSPKHIDVPELLKVMRNAPYLPQIQTANLITNAWHEYSIPVQDFRLCLCHLDGATPIPAHPGSRMLMSIEGSCMIYGSKQEIMMQPGDTVLIPAIEQDISVSGKGLVVFAS